MMGGTRPRLDGMASLVVANLIDAALVHRLGPAAQAGVGLGSWTFFLIASASLGLAAVVRARVAQQLGEGRPAEAGATLDSALAFGVGLAVPLGLALSLGARPILTLLSADPAVVDAGSAYLQIRGMALAVVTATACLAAFCEGIGRPGFSGRAFLATHGLHATLAWVLIRGELGAPILGVSGAALAAVIAPALGAILYIVLLWTDHGVRGTSRPFRFGGVARGVAWTLVRRAGPEVLARFGLVLIALTFLRLHSALGTREAAVGAILLPLAALGAWMALAMAGAVARSLDDPEGTRASAGRGSSVRRVLVFSGAALGLALLACAPGLVLSVFTPDGVVIELGRGPLRLLGLALLIGALPWALVPHPATLPGPRWAAVSWGAQALVVPPLAWVLAVGPSWGVTGLWASVLVSRVMGTLVHVWWLRGAVRTGPAA